MNIRRNGGLTLIGFVIVLAVCLFFAYAGMRLIPMYLEYHGNRRYSDEFLREQIKTKIQTSLWASYASNNITKDHMKISKKSDGLNVRVKYEVRKPFLGNVDIVAKFDRTVVLRSSM